LNVPQALAASVARSRAAAVAFLQALVRVPTDTPPGDNAPHAARAAELLEGMGFEVARHAVPEPLVRAHGLASITNLLVRHRFGDGPTIALNAHGDVVAPGAGWTHPPYGAEVHGGAMYGRGVAVSKSDFATYAFALAALRDAHAAGAALRGTVELHFTYDEEMGGALGPAWLLAEKLTRPDFAICAGFSYAIVTAHNGCLHLQATVRGRSAHAAIPESGADALRASVAMLEDLYASRDALARSRSAVAGIGSPTLNVGTIAGGINTNVVPDQVVFRLDRRMIPEEDPAAVEAALRRLLVAPQGAMGNGISVAVERLLLARALKPLPGHERLVAALQRHGARVFGEPIPATGVPLYTDARLYAEQGVPVVLYGAGPRTIEASNAKRADEHLVLEDLHRATEVVACAVAELLGAD
jgi:acetylornithine deacetylase/succinyl-diaminopimelate desuccinylase-like protein